MNTNPTSILRAKIGPAFGQGVKPTARGISPSWTGELCLYAAIKIKIWVCWTANSSKTVQICTPKYKDKIWTVFGQFLGMGTSDFYLDLFSVIVVQMRSFWIPTSVTFEQLEFSLLLRYFKFSNGEAPS